MAPKKKKAVAAVSPKRKQSGQTVSKVKVHKAEKEVELPPKAGALTIDTLTSATKRKLIRRDSEGQVKRLIEEKLAPLFKEEVIAGARSIENQTVHEFTEKGLKGQRGKGYLTSKFWAGVYVALPTLRTNLSSICPIPPKSCRCVSHWLLRLRSLII